MKKQNKQSKILKLFSALLFLILLQPAYSTEFKLNQVIAYPNPFSPETDKLTIHPDGSSSFSGTVQYYVYDYNEKEVYSGQVTNSAVYWSGYFANGSRVMPGLYFIKIVVTASDYSTAVSIVKVIVK